MCAKPGTREVDLVFVSFIWPCVFNRNMNKLKLENYATLKKYIFVIHAKLLHLNFFEPFFFCVCGEGETCNTPGLPVKGSNKGNILHKIK